MSDIRLKISAKGKKVLFLAVCAAAIFLMALVLCIFTRQNGNRITEQNREYLLDNTRQMADNIDAALTEGYDNIRMLSSLISDTLTGPEYDVMNIQGHIQNSVYDFIEFADREGMDHNITGGVSDARDRRYYLDAREGNTGMELIYVSRATHETLLMFYSPLYYETEFVGSLVGVYQASNRLTRLLNADYFGEKALAYLATDSGRIIACSQGFDPQNEMYIKDIAAGDRETELLLSVMPDTQEPVTFSLPGNQTGGCMLKLAQNSGYLVQIFPQAASARMISDANRMGYMLVGFMVLLYLIILISLVIFYRSQQHQVEEARNQAETASQAKTRFLFKMSHDIRTPMNAILGYTDIGMRHVNDKETAEDSFHKIKTAGGHLLQLINDILEMSRIESGNLALTEAPTDLREIMTGVETMGQALAVRKSIDLVVEKNDIRDPYVYTDELHLSEVLVNLISNAIKYTPSGGKVRFRCEQIVEKNAGSEKAPGRDNTVYIAGSTLDKAVPCGCYRFTVADNGIGMSEEFQKHLFEAFSREDHASVNKTEGSGLGLSIVKRIVDMAGGRIGVSSQPGEGSVFTVDFTLRQMADEDVRTFIAESKENDSIRNSSILKDKRVLLVEDNEMNREIATDILTEAGLIVETAEDGAIALKTITDKGIGYYDFILMDIQMPVMNGFEATRAIRKAFPDSHIPIIALSANAFAEDKAASLDAGMDDHVAKPIDINVLFDVIKKHMPRK